MRTAGHAGVELLSDASSVPAARAFVRSTLLGWGLDEPADTACLLTSELATNAVLHARTAYLVEVERRPHGVRVTVFDDSRARPRRRSNALQATTGRGLALVEALAESWGLSGDRTGHAKGIWFELPLHVSALSGDGEGAMYGQDWLEMVDDL